MQTTVNRSLLFVFAAAVSSLLLPGSPAASQGGVVEVTATVETDPVLNGGDAADDIAIWVHPSDRSLSTVIGTDKTAAGGLTVYDLAGRQLYFYQDGNMSNVDLRYGFPLGNQTVTLVGATNRTGDTLDFYKIEEGDRSLTKVGSIRTSSAIRRGRGFAMYRSPTSGRFYAFVTDYETNIVEQYELSGETGSVTGAVVRSFDNGESTEGMVADDELRLLYVAEEDVGIWRYGAEPGDGEARTIVDRVGTAGGQLTHNIKGLAIYYSSQVQGYLIAASQGNSSFQVYDRNGGAFLGKFRIVTGEIDRVSGQDGIDVTNYGLNAEFSQGLFVSQDSSNDSANQNFKLVPWRSIASNVVPPLVIDTSANPYQLPAPAVTLAPTPTPTSGATTATPSPPVHGAASGAPGGGTDGTSIFIVTASFIGVAVSLVVVSGFTFALKR